MSETVGETGHIREFNLLAEVNWVKYWQKLLESFCEDSDGECFCLKSGYIFTATLIEPVQALKYNPVTDQHEEVVLHGDYVFNEINFSHGLYGDPTVYIYDMRGPSQVHAETTFDNLASLDIVRTLSDQAETQVTQSEQS